MSTRARLTAKHPRPATPERAPVRRGSTTARKPVRNPATAAPVAKPAAKPAFARGENRPGERSGAKPGAPRERDTANRPVRSERPAYGKPAGGATRGGKPGGFGAKPAGERARADDSQTGERRRTGPARDAGAQRPARSWNRDERPARRGDGDERRPPRARSEGFGDERRPARARPDGTDRPDNGRHTFGDRKAPGAAPRREYGSADNRRTGPERGGAAPRTRRNAGDGDGPARKIATRVKQDDRTPRRSPVETSGDAAPRRAAYAGTDATGSLRLSKRMSELGLCSRREADEWIEKGWVLVDGERIDTLGAKVTPDQRIEIDPAARAAQARQVTILLHKPVGYVSGQAEDGYPPAATLVTAANQWDGDRSGLRFSPLHLRTLAPAGRLDIDSTGLLVLTQDGRVAKQLIGEQSDIDKEYLVRVTYGDVESDVEQHFPAELLAKLRHGLSLDDVPLKPAMVSWQNGEQLRFVLREGKKRQIRRMCELVGLKAVGLKRVRMGRVLLGALPQGQWRYLTPDESF